MLTDYLPKDLLAGHVVFVTGGGSGINLGIACNFAAVGADVGLCGRTAEKLERARHTLEERGARVSTHVADVRDYDALQQALEKTRAEIGPVHTLVCGAAGNFPALAEHLSAGGFKAVVDIDLLGSFNACRAAFDQLKETRGVVLFVSAGQSFIPYMAQVHCGAAKAGVDNLMRNLALEWGRYGIRSNSIAPGLIDNTEGMHRLVVAGEGLREQVASQIPLGRLGTVDDIGQMAVLLSSPLAAFVTGTCVVVDGGMNLPGSGFWNRMIMEAGAMR